VDAHSNMSVGLLDNCQNITNHQYALQAISETFKYDQKFHLISIDSGAAHKIDDLAQFIYSGGYENFDIIQCDKKRNPKNGEIIGFEVHTNDLGGLPCFTVDDICDGGASFIYAAKAIRNKNGGNQYLFTTHGIYSKGFTELLDHYNIIFCTNSFSDIPETQYVKQYKIQL